MNFTTQQQNRNQFGPACEIEANFNQEKVLDFAEQISKISLHAESKDENSCSVLRIDLDK